MSIATSKTSSLAFTDMGTGGPALLFIPGWCGDRSVFTGLAVAASRHRRAVTIDLPDHGESPARAEFSSADVVADLIRSIADLGLGPVVPVTLSHAGWFAVELRRQLGQDAVPAVVLLDWMVLGTPPPFADALTGLQSPAWADVRAGLFGMWTDGLDLPELRNYVASMGSYGQRHWQRAAREIQAGFTAAPVPLSAFADLQPCPVLHLHAQPADDVVLTAQAQYAAAHPWFQVTRLDARSHFPMFEVPDVMVTRIESFLAELP